MGKGCGSAAHRMAMVGSAMTEYEPVIGLEIHVQLATKTKMFCGCALSFGDEPNTHTCPVCLGLPGALPTVNATAIHYGLMIGMALNSQLADRSVFDRKNYFYADLPKGYQISQNDDPLCVGGEIGGVQIHRVHLEEDAAKLNHQGGSGRISDSHTSTVDFNRGGTPLAEIVTEPDIHSAKDAGEFLRLLRVTLKTLGVSDVNMEEGSLRCDANISVRPVGSTTLGTKTELKNMNSFRFIERGIDAEIKRQISELQAGRAIKQETMHFNTVTEQITSMRSKEEAHDYRYFPEPDLLPIAVSEPMLAAASAAMVELPAEREARFAATYGLGADNARLLAWKPTHGDFFEAAAAYKQASPGSVANWVVELQAKADVATVTPEAISELAMLVENNVINTSTARGVLQTIIDENIMPSAIVERDGLAVVNDEELLHTLVAAALEDNPDIADRIRAGDMKPIGRIIGIVMQGTNGRADGAAVTAIIRKQLIQ